MLLFLDRKKKAVENAYHVEIGEDDVVFLKKVASRKKQLYPDIAHHLIKIQKKEAKEKTNEGKEIKDNNNNKENENKKDNADESTKDDNKKNE